MAEPGVEAEPGGEAERGPERGPEPGGEPEPEPEPGAASAEAVLRELELFELRCDGEDVPGRLLELCVTHALGPVTLANELLAFVTTKELGTQLSTHTLDAFEHEVLSRRSSRVPRRGDRPHRGLHDIQSLQDLLEEEEEDELLDAYTTPSKGARKRSHSSPEQPRHKRLPSRSPLGAFSPGSFSPSVTPSRHYASRGGRGDVVATFGDAPGTPWSSLGTPSCAPRLFGPPERHLSKPYKFMFQKPLDVREVMLWRMEELGDALKRHHQLEDFAPVTLPAQEPVTVLGQIACDSAGKLNAHSVLLVGDAAHAGGAQIPLDLSELTEFSLFPGQIVALEGTNSTRRRMRVTRIYEGVPLPFHAPTEPLPDQVSVLVACGPFTPSDGVAFEPLRDLLDVIERDRPDLCLLLGPFLDARHEQVQRGELPGSFGEVFRLCLRCILDSTSSWRPPLVVVPSPRDVALPPVFPQPPLPWPDLPRTDRTRVLLVPNPCTLELGGTVLGVTSTDLLLHLGAEETNRSAGGSDRFTRILKHILTQHSYYPLYPPSEELNVDYESLYSHGSLPVTPHVLVTPSDLRYFVKDVLGCVCLNPGRLAKGRAGGTFGRLSLRRGADGTPSVAAQVVRI